MLTKVMSLIFSLAMFDAVITEAASQLHCGDTCCAGRYIKYAGECERYQTCSSKGQYIREAGNKTQDNKCWCAEFNSYAPQEPKKCFEKNTPNSCLCLQCPFEMYPNIKEDNLFVETFDLKKHCVPRGFWYNAFLVLLVLFILALITIVISLCFLCKPCRKKFCKRFRKKGADKNGAPPGQGIKKEEQMPLQGDLKKDADDPRESTRIDEETEKGGSSASEYLSEDDEFIDMRERKGDENMEEIPPKVSAAKHNVTTNVGFKTVFTCDIGPNDSATMKPIQDQPDAEIGSKIQKISRQHVLYPYYAFLIHSEEDEVMIGDVLKELLLIRYRYYPKRHSLLGDCNAQCMLEEGDMSQCTVIFLSETLVKDWRKPAMTAVRLERPLDLLRKFFKKFDLSLYPTLFTARKGKHREETSMELGKQLNQERRENWTEASMDLCKKLFQEDQRERLEEMRMANRNLQQELEYTKQLMTGTYWEERSMEPRKQELQLIGGIWEETSMERRKKFIQDQRKNWEEKSMKLRKQLNQELQLIGGIWEKTSMERRKKLIQEQRKNWEEESMKLRKQLNQELLLSEPSGLHSQERECHYLVSKYPLEESTECQDRENASR